MIIKIIIATILVTPVVLYGSYIVYEASEISDGLSGPAGPTRCAESQMTALARDKGRTVEVDDVFCDDGWATSEVYRVYIVSVIDNERKKTQILMQWLGAAKSDMPTLKAISSDTVEIDASRKLVKEVGGDAVDGLKIRYNLR